MFDKGTLDAMSENKISLHESIKKYFNEVNRVLKNGGRFICITLLQEHVLNALLDYFPKNNFLFRVVRCIDVENESNAPMPVFAVVLTKFLKLHDNIFEISYDGERIERMINENVLCHSILSIQNAAMIRNNLVKKKNNDDEIHFDLFRPHEKIPRYSLFILDKKCSKNDNGYYAAFICPQGRECDWLFSTNIGRKKLQESASYGRLAIITMHRNQSYTSLDDIKSEINETIKSFAPKEIKNMKKIPFLSLGSDDIGKRNVVHTNSSVFSGDFVVEDLAFENNQMVRRLIFMNNPNIIQSEARLKKIKNKLVVDHRYLSCAHHMYILLGILMIDNTKNLKNLVIGLGGGGLFNFIYHHLKELTMVIIEIDEAIVKVAKDFFGLIHDKKRLEIVIADGLDFLKKTDLKFNTISFDIDSKAQNQGISCPPIEFLDKQILIRVKDLLSVNGIFILNFVCRDENRRSDTLKSLKDVFPMVLSYKLDEDVNEIFYCFCKNIQNYEKEFQGSAKKINATELQHLDVNEFFEKLKIND